MTYRDRLRKRWVVVRRLPQMQRLDIAWFYQYSDAEGHAKILHRLDPTAQFEVLFDVSFAERQNLCV